MSNDLPVSTCPGVDPALDRSHTHTAKPESLAGNLRHALMQIPRRMRNQRGEANLPEGQHSALSALYFHGAMTPGGLAEHEAVKPPPMTRTLNLLADSGLVTKAPHPSDGRQLVVELTPLGIKDVLETRRLREQWLAERIAELPQADQEVLARAAVLLSGLGA